MNRLELALAFGAGASVMNMLNDISNRKFQPLASLEIHDEFADPRVIIRTGNVGRIPKIQEAYFQSKGQRKDIKDIFQEYKVTEYRDMMFPYVVIRPKNYRADYDWFSKAQKDIRENEIDFVVKYGYFSKKIIPI